MAVHRELGKHPPAALSGLILQPGGHRHDPWLSVNDRWRPMLRARWGHGRRGRRNSKPAGDGRQLGRKMRPALGDHPPRRQAAEGGAAELIRRAWLLTGFGVQALAIAPRHPGIAKQASPVSLELRRGVPANLGLAA